MKGKVFFCQNLILVILLLGQLHGYRSCLQKERKALLELKKYIISITYEEEANSVLPTWTNDTKGDCCCWKGVACNRTSRQVIGIYIGETVFKESSLLNLSLLHPFEKIRSLNLSGEGSSNSMASLMMLKVYQAFSQCLVYPCGLYLETYIPALKISNFRWDSSYLFVFVLES